MHHYAVELEGLAVELIVVHTGVIDCDYYIYMQADQSYVRKNIKAFKLTTSSRFFLVPSLPYLDLTIRQGALYPTNNLEENSPSCRREYRDFYAGRDKKFVFNEDSKSISVSLVLGALDVLGYHYLVYASEVFLVGKYFDSSVYHIAAIDYLPFGDKPQRSDTRDKITDILS